MLNRFRNALYGTSASDDSSLNYDYGEAIISKRIRSALTRSSSFREDLLSETSKNRNSGGGRKKSNDTSPLSNSSSIHRGRSQVLAKPHSTDKEGSQSSNHHQSSTKSSNRNNSSTNSNKVPKFKYSRPEFLQLKTDDEISVSADHQIRPIILPRDGTRLPWKSGYAECINAGKSIKNEDQAACYQDFAIRYSSSIDNDITDNIPWTYFGIFDGHAGTAVAVAAATQLHKIIGEKLNQVADLLIALEFEYDDQVDDAEEDFVDCASSPNIVEENPLHKGNTANDKENNNISAKVINDDKKSEKTHSIKDSGTSVDIESDNQVSKNNQSSRTTSSSSSSSSTATEESTGNQNSSDTETKNDKTTTTSNTNAAIESKSVDPSQGSTRGQDASSVASKVSSLDLELHLPTMVEICRSNITVDSLITGALEAAFWEMDALIESDKHEYKMAGGCTAIVGLFILGKLYVCNAGDSRAIVYKNNKVIPMSFDFTPTSERERILRLGLQRPEFLGDAFTHLEFARRPTRRDLGKQMLYKDAYMTGWSMKTITYDDLRFPLVWGEGKRSRVLATIGVTRGFGDHELRAQYGSLLIKPFLTPEPEVKILPLEEDETITSEDVLIMGSDGLWDVTNNDEAGDIVRNSFDLFPDNEESRSKYRYITAAQDLVIHSRGHTSNWNNIWRTQGDRLASLDDIAVFVIPLKQYKDEYLEWKRLRCEAASGARSKRHS